MTSVAGLAPGVGGGACAPLGRERRRRSRRSRARAAGRAGSRARRARPRCAGRSSRRADSDTPARSAGRSPGRAVSLAIDGSGRAARAATGARMTQTRQASRHRAADGCMAHSLRGFATGVGAFAWLAFRSRFYSNPLVCENNRRGDQSSSRRPTSRRARTRRFGDGTAGARDGPGDDGRRVPHGRRPTEPEPTIRRHGS